MALIRRVLVFDREEMARRGRRGAAVLHARHDSRLLAQRARTAFLRKFEDAVDPDRVLSEPERRHRAREALGAHMRRLAVASAEARRARVADARDAIETSA